MECRTAVIAACTSDSYVVADQTVQNTSHVTLCL